MLPIHCSTKRYYCFTRMLLRINQSFWMLKFIIKDIIINVYVIGKLVNLPFNYPYFNLSEKSIKKRSINFDVILSASIYFKSPFLYLTPQSCYVASRQFKDLTSKVFSRFSLNLLIQKSHLFALRSYQFLGLV